ncbi:UNVERIFIED_CONTAM: hypothetical protein GTU68_059694 [Idotea baltica]|nr:hypothetical protein [Idotea baltica]
MKDYRSPVDHHVTSWLRNYLGDDLKAAFSEDEALLPDALILEKHGISRLLSLPANSDKFESDIVSSYRTWQGVLHNPAKDRRTTKGVFHVAEGGLAIAGDKLTVPRVTFAHMLKAALNPPKDLMVLPYTSEEEEPTHAFASILLRPVVCPRVPGFTREKSLEVRFFAPGNLVANLDFVESIFGNAGDPFLPENDARLDVQHWTGHTGCVILAPQLTTLKKKDVGLPHISEASDSQKAQNMCWENEDELYNDGGAFKITARDENGVVVTLIADNYFGYCKKEVKTQISFSANLYGLAEEEHAGGALVFPSFDLGENFALSEFRREVDHTFAAVSKNYAELMDVQLEGYGIDKTYPNIIYLPNDATIDLHAQSITWDDGAKSIGLSPENTYVMPSGYKVEMRKPSAGQRWRLVGTNAEGTFCHKPCTVSGGGKSEISKSLADAMEEGPVIMPDFENDMRLVTVLLDRNYADRYKNPKRAGSDSRKILDPDRSFGSVIRLFSQSSEFTDAYNEFISTIPRTVRDFILTLKRYWKPDWGTEWRSRFHVDSINGQPGTQLKYRLSPVRTQFLRVGFDPADGSWRMFGLRKDFSPATKLQREDDITASVTVPAHCLDKSTIHPDVDFPSYKFAQNCEYRLFQRPDDAIHRGYDKQTELDFSIGGNFFSNYEPITREEGQEMVADAMRFGHFTEPLQKTLKKFAKGSGKNAADYAVSSAHPRIVDGSPTKNPRYLQNRPDLENPRSEYLADVGARFYRKIPMEKQVLNPVHAVLPGRRNNPADAEAGIRPLAVYGPIHYQELPELFMDFVASLTGKSPSTTGAGSEGALTKGPFNALLPIIDLNGALLSFIVSGYEGFSTAAGYVGPKYKVDHDVSLVVPEVWSRMFLNERDPKWLIENGYLEKIDDFKNATGDGMVFASRLGYRITESFVQTFFGRMFTEPGAVFTEEMLRPELQSEADYLDGIANICETQQRVAARYFEDGSIDLAIPPLKALLHIMAHGDFEGKSITDPEIRGLFDCEAVLESDWYLARLNAKLAVRRRTLTSQIASLEAFLDKEVYASEAERLNIQERLDQARERIKIADETPEVYLKKLRGTLGADVVFG